MAHILDKYDNKKHFFTHPFPHIIIEDCLDENLYNLLADKFPDNDSFKPSVKTENKAYWITGSDLANVSNVWADFIDKHVSKESFDKFTKIICPFMKYLDPDYLTNLGKDLPDCSFQLAEAGGSTNPRNKETDVVISISAGINTPCKTKSTVDTPHADIPQKIFNSLLYMRTDNDDSLGGDLMLYQTSKNFLFTSKSEWLHEVDKKYIKEIKTVKYSKNVFLLFPQRINAIHGVTMRMPTSHTRRYININMESYTLKRSVFFKAPRSLPARIKFALKKVPAISRLRELLK